MSQEACGNLPGVGTKVSVKFDVDASRRVNVMPRQTASPPPEISNNNKRKTDRQTLSSLLEYLHGGFLLLQSIVCEVFHTCLQILNKTLSGQMHLSVYYKYRIKMLCVNLLSFVQHECHMIIVESVRI